jgi:hypothetical protein
MMPVPSSRPGNGGGAGKAEVLRSPLLYITNVRSTSTGGLLIALGDGGMYMYICLYVSMSLCLYVYISLYISTGGLLIALGDGGMYMCIYIHICIYGPTVLLMVSCRDNMCLMCS